MKIFKFGPFQPEQSYAFISGKILHFDRKGVEYYVWALEGNESHRIHIYGTGWDIPNTQNYIGTALSQGGFVWHAFEES